MSRNCQLGLAEFHLYMLKLAKKPPQKPTTNLRYNLCTLTQGTRLFIEDRVYICTFAKVKIFLEYFAYAKLQNQGCKIWIDLKEHQVQCPHL